MFTFSIITLSIILVGFFVFFYLFIDKLLSPQYLYRILTLGMVISITLLVIFTWKILDNDYHESINKTKSEVTVVLDTITESLTSWTEFNLKYLSQIANKNFLIEKTQYLLTANMTPQALTEASKTHRLGKYFSSLSPLSSYTKFYIINKNGIVIGGSQQDSVGFESNLMCNQEKLLEKVFRGNSLFSVINCNTDKPVSLYFIVPIYNQSHEIIAALAMEERVCDRFSTILQRGRIGETGESYAIDPNGYLISESRFESQLKSIGLIKYHNEPIKLFDPGINLLTHKNNNNTALPYTYMAQHLLSERGNNTIHVNMSGYRDYRGVLVFGAWRWIPSLGIGLVTEIDVSEALSGYFSLRYDIAVGTFFYSFFTLLITLISLFAYNFIYRVLKENETSLEKIVKMKTRKVEFQNNAINQHAMVITLDKNGYIDFANQKFLTETKLGEKLSIGVRFKNLISLEKQNDFYDNLWATVSQGAIWNNELCICRDQEQPLYLHTTIVPELDEYGIPKHFICLMTDISKLKKTEYRLIESERRYKLLLDEIGDEFVVFSFNLNGVLTYVSDGIKNIFGLDKNEAIGKPWAEIINWEPHDLEEALKDISLLAAKKKNRSILEVRFTHPNSKIKTVKALTHRHEDAQNNILSMDGIVEDITLLKQTQVALVQSKEMAESANRAKSAFLANMSHEMRTPLNAIINFAHLCITKTHTSNKQFDYLRKVETSANQLLHLINDLLDLSKIEADELILEEQKFVLDNLLIALSRVFEPQIAMKNVEMYYFQDPNIPIYLIGDFFRLTQILINLVTNAIKFTNEGYIRISINIKEKKEKKIALHFSIEDTGIGISEEEQKKLFKPFMQVDTSITKKYGGTGLGLSIGRKLARKMGGDMEVKSSEGKGAIFYFWVNLNIASETNPWDDFHKKINQSQKILIVSSKNNLHQTLNAYLTKFGFELIFTDSQEAIARIKFPQKDLKFIIFASSYLPDKDIEFINCLLDDETNPNKLKAIILLDQKVSLINEMPVAKDKLYILFNPFTPSQLFDSILAIYDEPILAITGEPVSQFNEEIFQSIQPDTILLVEDNQLNQEIVVELLEKSNLIIDLANNGLEAIEMAAKKKYSLILMDIQMPIMDGYTAILKIREIPGYNEIPIIALTAHALQSERQKAEKVGFNEYITKPIVSNQLHRVLSYWLKGNIQSIKVGFEQPISNVLTLNIPGLDEKQSIARLGGHVKTYLSILEKFSNIHEDLIKELQEALQGNDKKTIQRILHTIKGTTATVGAKHLTNEFLEAEKIFLEHGDIDKEKINNLIKQLIDLIKSIDAALKNKLAQNEKKTNEKSNNYEELISWIHLLETSLNEYNSDADQILLNIIERYDLGKYEFIYIKIKQFIESYDYESALIELNTLLTMLTEDK